MPHPYTYLGVDRPWLVYTRLCTMEIEGHKAVEPHLYLSEECVQLVSSMSNPGAGRWGLLVRVCSEQLVVHYGTFIAQFTKLFCSHLLDLYGEWRLAILDLFKMSL